ncbi:alpha/beta hydrolase [Paenibacillus sp. FSL R7-0331]|uniref:alpha/beta hydrolase n=1 Tax=Paenibacillus sp. FSL R7-0331 TaxID=1536773 RepID=UPI0004F7B776|nr:alpha/beta hydrolase-fold protein [Paenibacillus sp. FSL R7-0331]AIQ53519.1 alpha/beta hydrolase [Paenibacillus sp. FSL R7-0331]
MSSVKELTYPHQGCEEIRMTAGPFKAEYRLLLAHPAGEAPPEGYPVIYALDGHAVFHTLAEAARLQTRKPHGYDPVLIVAVGYPSGEPFDMTRRCYDFTMPVPADTLPQRPDGTDWPEHGGADSFLELLEQEIMPLIAGRFPVDRKRQAIFGHSLGGLLVLHALFTRPALFSHYAAGSPSSWWGDYKVLKELDAFAAGYPSLELQRRLLITIGAEELEHMVEDAGNVYERLERLAAHGLEASLVNFAGENHVSVLPAALSRLLRFALEKQ